MKYNVYQAKSKQQQQGVVLAVTLIMLVLITLLAVSGMRSTTMEERMASNSRNSNVAFQMAESALREGEKVLQAAPGALLIADAQANTVPSITCVITLNSADFTLPNTWSLTPASPPAVTSCQMTGNGSASQLGTSNLPRYFIEFMYAEIPTTVGSAPVPRNCFYRITSRGYGPDVNSFVTLQTTYKFDSCT